jgi:hypothetical protein
VTGYDGADKLKAMFRRQARRWQCRVGDLPKRCVKS